MSFMEFVEAMRGRDWVALSLMVLVPMVAVWELSSRFGSPCRCWVAVWS